jgi:radical SAM family uncharacterized protein/radical SAM-linked protein
MTDSSFLPFVTRPGRYLGCEYQSVPAKAATNLLHWALVFPDLYEIGMSHQGLQILYHLLNGLKHVQAERCYCPAPDAEAIMREQNITLTTLESGRPLKACDLIGITLPHELCYTNILTILDRAGLPFYAAERLEGQPIVIGGGPCAFNPEPVAEFFDAILLGDGEEAIVDIAGLVLDLKAAGTGRREIIEALAGIDGVYLPHRYQPTYDETGRIATIEHRPDVPARVRRRILASLDRIDHLTRPLVPNAKIVHDRLGIEVARGCTRGCRFCQAGMTYRPVRERSVEQVCALAEAGITNSGFDEIALLSLSTGDYSCLPEVLPRLMNRFSEERVSISMPSMRVGTLGPELMEQIKRVRKTGFTLAPEAGSERLRRAINKGISEDDLLSSAEHAFRLGWNLIKLYFMIGLPGETMADIDAIAELAQKTAQAGKVSGRGRRRVNVSVGTFVPKPHTPFQWDAQLTIEQGRERLERLRAVMARSGLKLKYHDPQQSYLEGVFARGDRRLTALIIGAWQRGARLDSWSDYFDLGRWQAAASGCAIDLDLYLRARDHVEILPWQHLDAGIDIDFLLRERDHAEQQLYTPDCRYHGCQQCGLCDFKTIQPLVRNRRLSPPDPAALQSPTVAAPPPDSGCKYLICYSRTGPIRYLGHLELLQVIFRAVRRAGLRPLYSHGFNPSPKISFGPALPVGTESLCEFLMLEHDGVLTDLAGQADRLSRALPPGLDVTSILPHQGKVPQDIVCCYEVQLPFDLDDRQLRLITDFTRAENFVVQRRRKNNTTSLDLRPLVKRLSIAPPRTVLAEIVYQSSLPGCKPLELLAHILACDQATLSGGLVRKTSWRPLSG